LVCFPSLLQIFFFFILEIFSIIFLAVFSFICLVILLRKYQLSFYSVIVLHLLPNCFGTYIFLLSTLS
jgi:hypothetical protein